MPGGHTLPTTNTLTQLFTNKSPSCTNKTRKFRLNCFTTSTLYDKSAASQPHIANSQLSALRLEHDFRYIPPAVLAADLLNEHVCHSEECIDSPAGGVVD